MLDVLEGFSDIQLDLPGRREGKVRVAYRLPGQRLLFVTTDRLSAFDRVVACVPHKGQVLNELSAWWFERTTDIVANHLLDVPDPNVSVTVAATPLPVEVIVRGYITGVTDTSLWTRYQQGARVIDGHRLPDGLRKNTALPHAIITPTTKAGAGAHDEPLSPAEVSSRGLVLSGLWEQVCDAALRVFHRGQAVATAAGLILADTKYEFGTGPDGRLLLIDEVHTPDSSRFWVGDSYTARLASGEEPESLDKEVVRRALKEAGGRPIAPAVWEATSSRYRTAYERLTNVTFVPSHYPVETRVADALRARGIL